MIHLDEERVSDYMRIVHRNNIGKLSNTLIRSIPTDGETDLLLCRIKFLLIKDVERLANYSNNSRNYPLDFVNSELASFDLSILFLAVFV